VLYEQLGIVDCFHTLYGADLINTPKSAPAFYERIFAHACVDPAASVVVDDRPDVVPRIIATGARAVLVSRDGTNTIEGVPTISSLAELPALLASSRLG
jgi:FMN phosphatase YigB (HAD superfamily)